MSEPTRSDPTREEILIGRVTDGEASAADWSELDALAAADPGVWNRLAAEQRRHAALEQAVDDALTVGELVDLPTWQNGGAATWSARWSGRLGWAAAAAVALAWVGTHRAGLQAGGAAPSNRNGAPQQANLFPGGAVGGSGALLDQYLDQGREEGRVLDELPTLLVETRRNPDGEGSEVIYVRQILERATVREMYTVGTDEFGQPRPAPFVPSRPAPRPL